MSSQKKEPAKRQAARASKASEASDAASSSTRSRPSGSRVSRAPDVQVPLAGEQEDNFVVPLTEETLEADKQWKEAGAVELHKTVESRTESVPVDLKYEEVDIQRVPVNRALGPGEEAGPRQEGDLWIIPIIEEELVVTTRQVVREEVRIRKRQAIARKEATGTVRRENLTIDTTGELRALDDQGSAHA